MEVDFFSSTRSRHKDQDLRKLYDQIEWLKDDGTALVIRNLSVVPSWWNQPARGDIRRQPAQCRQAKQSALALQYVLAACGLRRLPERFAEKPQYISHVVGEEHDAYRLARHKLPNCPATLYPNKPFGPGLFGLEKGINIDSLSPDIVAFFMIDAHSSFGGLGPVIYTINDLENTVQAIDPSMIDRLKKTMFEVKPDLALTRNLHQPNGFGGVSHINVFGQRRVSKRKYMRFDISRLNHLELGRDAGPVAALRDATEKIKEQQNRVGVELSRGDILLVNNRNCALEWKRQGYQHELAGRSMCEFSGHERTVLRLMFYQIHPLEETLPKETS